VIGEAFSKRGAEAQRVAKLADAKGLARTAGVRQPEYLSALRAARNHVNTRADRWAFSPDAKCAEFVSTKVVPAVQDTVVLLCSDGFLALATDYARYDCQSLLDACLSRGLRPLCDELRTIEKNDPDGRLYPRFKVSDDATALLMKLSA
jgi:hypothetical protein